MSVVVGSDVMIFIKILTVFLVVMAKRVIPVVENCRFMDSHTYPKVCVECVTSLVTKVTSDDVTLNISGMLRLSKLPNISRHT